jgi:hypothetical protein
MRSPLDCGGAEFRVVPPEGNRRRDAMTWGTVVLGVLNGLFISLLAVGFVLVYKANRFLNLAHA